MDGLEGSAGLLTGLQGRVRRGNSEDPVCGGLDLRDQPRARVARPGPNREKPRRSPAYAPGELDAYVQACHAALTAPAVLEHVAALGVLINGFPDAAIVSAPPTVAAWSYLLGRGVGAAEVRRHRISYAVTGHPQFRNLGGRLILPCPVTGCTKGPQAVITVTPRRSLSGSVGCPVTRTSRGLTCGCGGAGWICRAAGGLAEPLVLLAQPGVLTL